MSNTLHALLAGHIVKSKLFNKGRKPYNVPEQVFPVVGGTIDGGASDPTRATATFYVAHIAPVEGSGPSAGQLATAIRLNGLGKKDAAVFGSGIHFEITAVCHERINLDSLEVVDFRRYAPARATHRAILDARNGEEAAAIVHNLFGFVPTSAPVANGSIYEVPGYKYAEFYNPAIQRFEEID